MIPCSAAQAKTGTGKTLGFLLPVIQRILQDPSLETRRGRWNSDASDIRAIIISPTRELAEQIAAEANKVVKDTGVVVQTAVGGTQKREGLRRIQRQGCHILVGTPGRLIDLLSDSANGISAPKLSAFVLDEADRLLDDGFAPDVARIQSFLPDRRELDRQTLMFSATMPAEVMKMVKTTMKPDFIFLRTVDPNETPTHLKVPQKMVVLDGLENQMPAVLELVKQSVDKHLADPENARPFKAIVYYNTTAEVALAMSCYSFIIDNPANSETVPRLFYTEMHSRLSQGQRTRNSELFRNCKSGILFSSDVTARGMDFPNVTHVIQCGIPRDRETYIHRLGRTARANKSGEGWLIIPEDEIYGFQTKLRKLPLKEDTDSLPSATSSMTKPELADPQVAELFSAVQEAFKATPRSDKHSAYRAYIGAYGHVGKKELIKMINRVALNAWCMEEPPAISSLLASKIGLARVPGVNIGVNNHLDEEDRAKSSSGGGGGSGKFRGNFDEKRGRSNDRFGGDRFGGRGGFGGGDRARGGFGGGDRARGGFGGDRFGGRGGFGGGDRGRGGFGGGDRGRGGFGGDRFGGRGGFGGGDRGRGGFGGGDRGRGGFGGGDRGRGGFGDRNGARRGFGRGDRGGGGFGRSRASF